MLQAKKLPKFELTFKSPVGMMHYSIEAADFVSAAIKVRTENKEIKENYPLVRIRKGN